MRYWSTILIFSLAAAVFAGCSRTPQTPLETFKTYTKAIKAKDTAAMKTLLSDSTLKMHEQEAKAQNVSVDDVIKRETLFGEAQTTVEYRDEKIDGDKATLEVKNQYGSWETVPFVREGSEWKIDKQGYANQMIKDMEESNRKLDEQINGNPEATPSF
ncbi:MAG: DUF2950 family protein [Pyrinomonadaceae bacterium]